MTSRSLKKITAALALATVCTTPWAAGLQVSPTMLTFQGNDSSEVLDLYNRGDTSSAIQIRVFHWTQDKGDDLLEAADDIIASPPVQQVAADGHQVVRLVRANTAVNTDKDERAYRVLVDELPQSAAIKGAGVNMLLRFSVPVFVPPAGGGKPEIKVSWGTTTTGKDGKRQYMLQIENSGNVHAQIVAPHAIMGDKDTMLNPGLYGYVLPHQTRNWPLPAGAEALFSQKGVNLKVLLNGTEVTLPINAS